MGGGEAFWEHDPKKNQSFYRRPMGAQCGGMPAPPPVFFEFVLRGQPPTPKDDANHSLSLPGVSREARGSMPAAGVPCPGWMGGFASRVLGGPIAWSLPGSRRPCRPLWLGGEGSETSSFSGALPALPRGCWDICERKPRGSGHRARPRLAALRLWFWPQDLHPSVGLPAISSPP